MSPIPEFGRNIGRGAGDRRQRGRRAEGQGAEGKGEEGQKQRQEELC